MTDNKRGKAAFFSDDDFNVETQAAVTKEDREKSSATQTHNAPIQRTYTIRKEETRSKRVQIVIKPSVNKKLDEMAKNGTIKSKNDLVNFLLESYIAQPED